MPPATGRSCARPGPHGRPSSGASEYPGRDSNPQCPRGRTAFKAADFASLSTRAGVCIVRGGSRTSAGLPNTRWGRPFPLPASRPAHSPAPDRRRVARSLGWFYLAAALLVGAHVYVDTGSGMAAEIDQWVIPVATLVVVGAMVHRLTMELGRAHSDRVRFESERAELEAGRAGSEAERAHREAAMGRLGRMALRVADRQSLLDEAVALITDTLGIADGAVLELTAGGDRVRLAAGAGAAIAPD